MKIALNTVLLLTAALSLNACNHYKVEQRYDEFRKKNICALKNHLMKNHAGLFYTNYRVEMDLEKQDETNILAMIHINADLAKQSFRDPPHISFKVYKGTGQVNEIRLVGSSVNTKRGVSPNYTPHFVHYTTYSDSNAFIQMTKAQVKEIAYAERVSFSLETLGDPITGELNKNDLSPIVEFLEKCF